MARIKRAVAAKKKRRTVMHRAKGYYGAASRTYKHAKEQVQHSLQYQYRDRRNKKRERSSKRISSTTFSCRTRGRTGSSLTRWWSLLRKPSAPVKKPS